jgi:DNA sulfur modification protein DndB
MGAALAKSIQTTFVDAKQGQRKFMLMKLPASVVTTISYAATRGQSDEEGAVQRVLNVGRINSVKAFALQGGDYPNAVVLNWVSKTNPLVRSGNALTFRSEANSAQIIDGQHRIAGIKAAIEERAALGKLELPVVIYRELTTQECADIFLSINTEQKPVARSLVFDLYGVASEHLVDQAAERARDIAMYLNTEDGSPYLGEIKLPGAPTRRGGIPLSSAVTGIKPLVEENGAFEQISVVELEFQKQVILHLFIALRGVYGEEWDNKANVFLYAAGFLAAMDFLKLQLIPYCNIQESFEVETIEAAIAFEDDSLIYQDEVKGQSGGGAQKRIHERLVAAFKPAKKASKVKFKI